MSDELAKAKAEFEDATRHLKEAISNYNAAEEIYRAANKRAIEATAALRAIEKPDYVAQTKVGSVTFGNSEGF